MILVDFRTEVYETPFVKGSEFLRRLKKLARRKRVACWHRPDRGKGSHGRVYFGENWTALKDPKKEIGAGLLRAMCNDLGIDPEELY